MFSNTYCPKAGLLGRNGVSPRPAELIPTEVVQWFGNNHVLVGRMIIKSVRQDENFLGNSNTIIIWTSQELWLSILIHVLQLQY
jgi:hypothetical protein